MKYSNRGHRDPFFEPSSGSLNPTFKSKNTKRHHNHEVKKQNFLEKFNSRRSTIASRNNRSQLNNNFNHQQKLHTNTLKQNEHIFLHGVAGTSFSFSNTINSTVDYRWHLKYNGHNDSNGLIYLLGTNFYRHPYQNPATMKEKKIFASQSSIKTNATPFLKTETDPANIFLREDIHDCDHHRRCQTKWNDAQQSWYQLDFGGNRTMEIQRYCMRGSGHNGNDCLVDWELQGRVVANSSRSDVSDNIKKWVVLKTHVGDRSLYNVSRSSEPYQYITYCVNGDHYKCDAIRITMTGVNSSGNASLTMCGLDVYGILNDPNMKCKTDK